MIPKYVLSSKSELGLNTATLLNSNKIIVCLCQKGYYQKDKKEARVLQNVENENLYVLLLESQISIIVMENGMEHFKN